jgi:hypothetical protein
MLTTVDRGRVYVMGFERSGMRGAQPTFQVYGADKEAGNGVMTPASKLAVREVPYRDDIVDIDNPDAALIVAACNALPALLDRLDKAEAALSVERIAQAVHDIACASLVSDPDFSPHPDEIDRNYATALHAALTSTDKETQG